MRVLEEPTQLVRVAHDVDRANTAVDDVERVGAVAGDRMAHQQTRRAVDRDELDVRLRPEQASAAIGGTTANERPAAGSGENATTAT